MENTGGVANVAGASPRIYRGFALAYAALCATHAFVLMRDVHSQLIESYVICGLVQWLTIAAVAWRWRQSVFPSTFRWALLTIALVFVNLANEIDLARALSGLYNPVPGASMFCDGVYAALIILACAATFRRRTVRMTNTIDATMAVALAALFFIRIFSVVSVAGSNNPDKVLFIVRMFDALGLFMSLGATVRLLGAESQQRRHFFFVVACFVWTSTIFAAVRNRLLAVTMNPFVELLLLPSFLVLGLLCLQPLPSWVARYRPHLPIVYLAESLSPLFLGLGLLCISISIWPTHPAYGAAGVCTAVIGYGLRNVITQSEQMTTERALRTLQGELQNLVVTDALTGVANRRGFDASLEHLWSRVRSADMCLTILMIDIDHFKRFNDEHGHLLGDSCLAAVANCLASTLEPLGGLVARYGGEEFGALLPGVPIEHGLEISETVRHAVANIVMISSDVGRKITVSIGVASTERSQAASSRELLMLADGALFDAKSRGRDQVAWRR